MNAISIAPRNLEPIRHQLGAANGMRNILVPGIMLDSKGVDAVVGHLLAGAVPKHVRIDRKADVGVFPSPSNNPANTGRCYRTLTFTDEQVGAVQIFPLKASWRANYPAPQGVGCCQCRS